MTTLSSPTKTKKQKPNNKKSHFLPKGYLKRKWKTHMEKINQQIKPKPQLQGHWGA